MAPAFHRRLAVASLLLTTAAVAGQPLPPAPDLPRLAVNDNILAEAAQADQLVASAPPPSAAAAPSISVTVNLIHQLVELGVLPKDKAEGLLKQAEAEAAQARAQLIAERDELAQAAAARALATIQTENASTEPLPPADQSSRVTYVPEVVRAQLRDEIKRDLASDPSTAQPPVLPKSAEWVKRFRFFADVRLRGEGVLFPTGNDNTGSFPNFNAINTGAPFDTAGTVFSPQRNVDKDRTRMRLQLRLGLESDLGDGFTAGLRIATGNTNSPTSTNQDLGAANNGQGGDFSKYALWLDRAYLKWQLGNSFDRSLTISAGRFENPFFSTEAIFDEDLGFDGIAIQAQYRLHPRFMPFLSAGAFPVFNTDFNFATTQPSKFSSTDKWLYGAQLGAVVGVTPKVELKLAAAYYYYQNVEGRLSDPFVPLAASDQGNTDTTRPSFAQNGNTYRPLRNILPSSENGFGTINQYQYYGLATPFRDVALTGQLDFHYWDPYQLSLYGEAIRNVGFNRGAIDSIAVNNRGPNSGSRLGGFAGGNDAFLVGLRFGKPLYEKRGDWSAGVNYRYIESDAVIDGFNDSDFGLGGTNQKGFTVWANVALSPRVNVGLRWSSSDQIAGPALALDIVQLDINASF